MIYVHIGQLFLLLISYEFGSEFTKNSQILTKYYRRIKVSFIKMIWVKTVMQDQAPKKYKIKNLEKNKQLSKSEI